MKILWSNMSSKYLFNIENTLFLRPWHSSVLKNPKIYFKPGLFQAKIYVLFLPKKCYSTIEVILIQIIVKNYSFLNIYKNDLGKSCRCLHLRYYIYKTIVVNVIVQKSLWQTLSIIYFHLVLRSWFCYLVFFDRDEWSKKLFSFCNYFFVFLVPLNCTVEYIILTLQNMQHENNYYRLQF